MQKTAYELWLKDQKKAMHLKCARFLEESAHKCDHCQSGDFIPFHHFTVNSRLNSLDMDTIKRMAKFQGLKGKHTSFLVSPSYSWRTEWMWTLRASSPLRGLYSSKLY